MIIRRSCKEQTAFNTASCDARDFRIAILQNAY